MSPGERRMKGRGSGILLHITSLPSPYGIGDLGPAARRFADFLHRGGQKFWQVLPVNPTRDGDGHSPYMSASAFAGNPLLISPELLVRDGYLDPQDLMPVPSPYDRVDFPGVCRYKSSLFDRAFRLHADRAHRDPRYQEFCRDNAFWLPDYALFSAISARYDPAGWDTWPEPLRSRDPAALKNAERDLRREIDREIFLQFLFLCQWKELRRYCNDRGIRIIGDMPIYVSYQSADLWAHPELFCLDPEKRPSVVAGVPPDYFSKTGQLWKNPLYAWPEHEKDGFSWWKARFLRNFSLFDLTRIDHFRGLVAYWEVPAGAEDATGGRWAEAPAGPFFSAMVQAFPAFPVLAEDLGVITPDVHATMRQFDISGMRVLQFAFTDEIPNNPHAPHNISPDLILYTGTHDNAPARGWLERHATDADRQRLRQYFGRVPLPEELPEVFIRTAMMSVAGTVIVPLQDLLGLGDEGRMNAPGTETGNWLWRADERQLTNAAADRLLELTRVYGRAEAGPGGT